MLDKHGVAIVEGATIQFDADYFGHGMQREVKSDENGVLGFEAIPNASSEMCLVGDWYMEIEVVTDKTQIRNVGKRVTLNGERYMY